MKGFAKGFVLGMLVAIVPIAMTFCQMPQPVPMTPKDEAIQVEVVVKETPVVKKEPKPALWVDKGGVLRMNKAAQKLLETTCVLHVQYGNGYDIFDTRNGKTSIQVHNWPDNWKIKSIGIYNPDTGKYVVSMRYTG